MNKKATITDVARLAGVGKTTVSRVLNTPELAGIETVKKVLSAVKTLDYKPSPIARALNDTKSRTISLVVPNVESSTMAEIIRGAMQYLTERNYSLLVLDSSENYATERDYFCLLQERMTDGVIFCYGSAKESMEPLRDLMPVVFVESSSIRDDIDQVLVDGIDAFHKLFEYLSSCGFKQEEIAIVFGKDDRFSRLRFQQCQRVLDELGMKLSSGHIIFNNWRPEDGYDAMKELLAQEMPPEVVVYFSDVMALGGMRAAHDLGLNLPEDISVLGFNDVRFSAYYQPSLTTLEYKPEQMGIAAAKQILNRITNSDLPVQKDIFMTDLQIRESVRNQNN
ncbi:MAG: LacI family DNA-binding transcriptional regulator [Firmicutes bacterium]|nr:LacI family DNA-binding transcriptional regulator [Bacillota bacterium]